VVEGELDRVILRLWSSVTPGDEATEEAAGGGSCGCWCCAGKGGEDVESAAEEDSTVAVVCDEEVACSVLLSEPYTSALTYSSRSCSRSSQKLERSLRRERRSVLDGGAVLRGVGVGVGAGVGEGLWPPPLLRMVFSEGTELIRT
jgi:hypothetical protein